VVVPSKEGATAVVVHDGCIALIERHRDGMHYWAVPGGGMEDGERPEQAAVREAFEELGLVVVVVRKLAQVTHGSGAGRPRSHVFLCSTEEATIGSMTGPERSRASDENTYEPRWVDVELAAKAGLIDGAVGALIADYSRTGSWPVGLVVADERELPT